MDKKLLSSIYRLFNLSLFSVSVNIMWSAPSMTWLTSVSVACRWNMSGFRCHTVRLESSKLPLNLDWSGEIVEEHSLEISNKNLGQSVGQIQGMSGLALKWVRLDQNGTNLGLFQIRIQYSLARRAKTYWILIWKFRFVQSLANLTHFGPKSGKHQSLFIRWTEGEVWIMVWFLALELKGCDQCWAE